MTSKSKSKSGDVSLNILKEIKKNENIVEEDSVGAKKSMARRRWTEQENQALLQYLLKIIRAGKSIEKPNATAFYKNAKQILKFDECTPNQLKNQLKNLKKKYVAAIEWGGKTGQGVLEEQGE
jgi:hypothetical protein